MYNVSKNFMHARHLCLKSSIKINTTTWYQKFYSSTVLERMSEEAVPQTTISEVGQNIKKEMQ